MSRHKYPADKKRSYVQIEREALQVRRALGLDLTGAIPGLQLFESLDQYRVAVGNGEIPIDYSIENLEPGILAEARFESDRGKLVVCLSEESYEDLENDVPRSRFSLFHEIGHAVLHPAELIRLSRIPRHQAALFRGQYSHIKSYEDVEWQANAFAAALGMPAKGLLTLEQRNELEMHIVAATFKTSWESADIRLGIYRRRRFDLLNA